MKDLNSPLVSVLLPSYNHCDYIEEAILSVVNQTYSNIELIVIDDGSTDGSVSKILALQEKYAFMFVQQENQGLISTIDTLFQLSKGEYISLFSSDDVYHEQKLEKLVNFLESNSDYSLVYSKIAIIDSQSNLVRNIEEPYQQGNIFCRLLSAEFFINGLTTLVRRDVYSSYGRIDTYIDDLQMWLALSKDSQIGFVDDITAFYRIHNNHLSQNITKMQASEEYILQLYSSEPCFAKAINSWNIRWFGSFAKCNKDYALRNFLPKILRFKNFFNLKFYIAVLKFILPCCLFKKQ